MRSLRRRTGLLAASCRYLADILSTPVFSSADPLTTFPVLAAHVLVKMSAVAQELWTSACETAPQGRLVSCSCTARQL